MTALQLIRRLHDATMQSKCIQRSHTPIGCIIYDDMELFVRGFDDVLNSILGERRPRLCSKTKRLAVNHTASARRFAAV